MKERCEVLSLEKFNQMNHCSPHAVLESAFQKLGIDITFLINENYLVITNYLFKWVEIEKINNKSVREIIKVFEMVIARFGVTETVVYDNSPFNCWEFKRYHTPIYQSISFTKQ